MFQPKYKRFFRRNLYQKIQNKIHFLGISSNLNFNLNSNKILKQTKNSVQMYTSKIYYQTDKD